MAEEGTGGNGIGAASPRRSIGRKRDLGRGVGLSAVRSELDRLGGSVKVEATPGQGTRFRFTLPIRRDAAAQGIAARA